LEQVENSDFGTKPEVVYAGCETGVVVVYAGCEIEVVVVYTSCGMEVVVVYPGCGSEVVVHTGCDIELNMCLDFGTRLLFVTEDM
jgi:hypothetical protein